MRVETTPDIPDDLKKALRDEYVQPFIQWQEALSHLTVAVHTIREGETPILALGSVKLSLLDDHCQLWCVLTKHFSLDKLAFARDYLKSYWGNYRGPACYAITRTPRDGKFARWFGGKLEKNENGQSYYRMSP